MNKVDPTNDGKIPNEKLAQNEVTDTPSPAVSGTNPVDGVTPPQPQNPQAPKSTVTPEEKKRMKTLLILFFSIPYAAYMIWSFFLMAVLPNAEGKFESLIPVGLMLDALFSFALIGCAAMVIMHIFHRKGTPKITRYISVAKVIAVIIPGLAIGGMLPLVITAEPPIYVSISDPVGREIVAPAAVTFSLEDSISVLERRGLKPIGFVWDFNGDGKRDEDTVLPFATAVYEQAGVYNVKVIVSLNDGTKRITGYRLVIPKAVFSLSPLRPVIDEPVRFSVEHLIEKPDNPRAPANQNLKEVRWDFDNDGEYDEVSNNFDAVYTFRNIGEVTVTAVVLLQNQVQQTYEKTFEIRELQELSFPVKLVTEPSNLISPPPFGVIFKVESEEELRSVVWDFGDNTKGEGERIGHTYRSKGRFPVVVEARTQSGSFAKLNTLVSVVDELYLRDLVIDGTPKLSDNTFTATVPASLDLTPRTNAPLIDFDWEAPGATVLGSTDHNLQAIYRRAGSYPISLIARDTEGRAMRRNYTLKVNPVSSDVNIRMTPDGGVAPLLVRFDASETVIPNEEITGFEWFFGNSKNTIPKQGGAQVEYLFQQPGTYSVLLRAFTTSGKTFEESRTIVVRAPVLDACFFPSRTSGSAPLGVKFDMKCSSGTPSSIEWDFGDGSQSEEKNPIHVFEESGIYQVTLTIQDTTGGISKELVTITVE